MDTPRSRSEVQRRRRTDARRRILDAASRLLEQRRWPEVRLEDVMGEAGLSRTAFYRHFDDRETLLLALLEEVAGSIGAVGGEWKSGAGTTAQGGLERATGQLRRGLAELDAAMREHGRLVQAIADAAGYDADLRAAREAMVAAFVADTAVRIDADVRAGLSVVEDPGGVADALVRMNEALLLRAFGQPPYPADDEVVQVMVEVWTATVYGRPAPGQRSR
jgi:AcrR family transcriptional regulator